MTEFKNIVLIGMSGVGKSHIGKNIASILGKNYIDSDNLIVQKEGLSIDIIFSKYGEEYFRRIEKDIIEEISTLKNSIISTGGGVILNPVNIENLKKNGCIFFLEAKISTIVNNLLLDTSVVRPLLKNSSDLYESVEKLYEKRREIYLLSCDKKISIDNKDNGEITIEILDKYDKLLSCGKL